MKKVDELPTQATRWTCDIVTSPGNQLTDEGEPVPSERLELWRRDPVECMKELMGNPMFENSLEYAPQKHFMDKEGNNRVVDEMWTGDWWWNTQVNLSTSTCNLEHELTEILLKKNIPIGSTIRVVHSSHFWLIFGSFSISFLISFFKNEAKNETKMINF